MKKGLVQVLSKFQLNILVAIHGLYRKSRSEVMD